ncbi:TPA: hypothetical protein ACIX13_003911 [Escherichia coli]
MAFVDGVVIMNEPRCIAQLLRNESPRAIDFTITHGKGRTGELMKNHVTGVMLYSVHYVNYSVCLSMHRQF